VIKEFNLPVRAPLHTMMNKMFYQEIKINYIAKLFSKFSKTKKTREK